MLCRALLAAVAVTYLICVLVLSGMQKEDLDVSLLRKLQRHNINTDDINSEKVRQECQVNSSDELSIMKARRNNDNSSLNQNITTTVKAKSTKMNNSSKTDFKDYNRTTKTITTTTKYVFKDRINQTYKSPYEVGATKDHNIKARSSVNDVNSTQTAKFSEAMTFFGDQKSLDNVMNMLQTFLKAKLENNNKKTSKSSSSQMTTMPPTNPTKPSKSKDSDMIKVLATFVFNKPIPVEPRYKLDDEKNSLISKLLYNIEAKSANTDRPHEFSNDYPTTTELFSDQEYPSYKMNTADIPSAVDEDYKPSVQNKLDQIMNEFRTQSKIVPKHTLEYEKNESTFGSYQTENLYITDLKNIMKTQTTRNYDPQKQFDDTEYSKLVDIIKPNKNDTNKNESAKSLHPDVIKEIANAVKELVLRDLRKEILPSTAIVRSTMTTTQKIPMTSPQESEKNHIQQATKAIQKFVELLEKLKSTKEFIFSPVTYDSSKESDNNSAHHEKVKNEGGQYQIKPKNKNPPANQNDFDKMNGYISNVAQVNEYKLPEYNVPIQYHQQYPVVSYYDNMSNNMVPPLVSNPYGVQRPAGRAIINVPQGMPHNNKHNTINIITPVNHTPVININQMRPAPITIQTSKEIPPLGIPVSMPSALNRNIVIPVQPAFVNETEKERWAYIMKYGRNPETRGELTDLKDKLAKYTNFRSTPTKEVSDKNIKSSILNFSSTNKRGKLTDYTNFSLPTIYVREKDKRSDSTVFGSSLFSTHEPDRLNYTKMFNSPMNNQEKERSMGNYNSYNLNVREPYRTSNSKTFNSLDKQERERMIDPTLITGDQAKDMALKKLNTNKQQQVYDEAVLSDIKAKLLYKDRYKTDDEYRDLSDRYLTSRMPYIPKHDYYDRQRIYIPHFLEVSANYPDIDPYVKRDYNEFTKRGPYREYIDINKPRDLNSPRQNLMPIQIHDIKGFHEKLEQGDYNERRDPVNVNSWYENPNSQIKHDATDCSKTKIESRQQLPLIGGTRMSKFDDTHFRNFLKTQQKVNHMLERILATKTSLDYVPSIETT